VDSSIPLSERPCFDLQQQVALQYQRYLGDYMKCVTPNT
jgi:hypothetical protein